MTEQNKFGDVVKTGDGSLTIRNPEIDEEYHSDHGALFESNHLYMAQSGYQEAIQTDQPIAVLDVGLGLGYNAIRAIELWLSADQPGDLTLLSLEKNPDLVTSIAKSTGPWCEGWAKSWRDIASSLDDQGNGTWHGHLVHRNGSALKWMVHVGDAANMPIPNLNFNFIFQDAFSPIKNPELWSADWFRRVAEASRSGCVLVTYSVARLVKDSLAAGGWDWEKVPSPGSKRHWLRASKVASTT